MISDVFLKPYAESYDRIYAEKDYERECDFIEQAHRRFGEGTLRTIIDLGCGTGAHAVPLARRGYSVTGVDRSSEMLRIAGEKIRRAGASVDLHRADVRAFRNDRRYDMALFMFAVLGYQTGNEDVSAALRTAREHLRPAGLLSFDVWYGPAVLTQGPTERLRTIPTTTGEVIRAVTPELHVDRNVVDVRIRTWRVDERRLVESGDEIHPMRYFFLPELDLFLKAAGFEPLAFVGFPNIDAPVTPSTWTIGCVARAQ